MFKESCVNNDNDCSVIKYNIFVDPKYAMTEFHLIFEHYTSVYVMIFIQFLFRKTVGKMIFRIIVAFKTVFLLFRISKTHKKAVNG